MSSIKNLFSKKSTKVLSESSLETITSGGVESPDFIRSAQTEKAKFEPRVDYSKFSNFARYGSGEQYYADAIGYIADQYPYDGSLKEKTNWNISASYFDTFVFENEYPRTNGFITLGLSNGSTVAMAGGYDESQDADGLPIYEFISFRGGPHTASEGMIGKPLSLTFTGSNYYNSSKNRESNLEINGINGNTIEFWFNKESFNATSIDSRRQIIFDSWNNVAWNDPSYGRLRVEISGAGTTLNPNFYVELLSGTVGFSSGNWTSLVEMSGTSLTGSWNHFALSFINSGSQMTGRLYQNGKNIYTVTTGSSIGKITGSMFGRIGALETTVSGTLGASGRAKLSASLDEFRFWKAKRTDTQIGRYWFSQIGAGSNTDTSNTKLGLYYKFNEGIVSTSSVVTLDRKVLDYSGRVTNGSWTGYVTGSRSTGSAMVLAGAAKSEFKDPILYRSQPDVASFISLKEKQGVAYDYRNNAGIYSTLPEWITSDEAEISGKNIKKLTQTLASYFDSLHLQIGAIPGLKNIQYISASQKPAPFVNRFLESVGLFAPEIWADAGELEYYASRDDYREFAQKIDRVKNKIYQNIYNNLIYIFKTKGTEKSFRNLIRCYGVGEPLVNINLYGDNLSYILRDNFNIRATRKKFVDFNDPDRTESSVYQQTASGDTLNTRNYITGSSLANGKYAPQTMQAEIIFPKKFKIDSSLYAPSTFFTTSSLFGMHTPVNDPADMTWADPDIANFQVQSVRTQDEGDDVYFQLTCSAGTILIDSSSGNPVFLTSSVYKEVYDNSKWNLAVRVQPAKKNPPAITGSVTSSYLVELIGYNSLGDNVENNFHITASIPYLSGTEFLTSEKRIYVGSEHVNFTSSVAVQQSDVKISSVRYWMSDLSNDAIEAHSKDASSFGPVEPHESAYLVKPTVPYFDAVEIPRIKTLALRWNFDNVTSSGPASTPTTSDATFFVNDLSSGSAAATSDYGWVGPIVNMRHPGKGDFFLGDDTGSVNQEFVYTAKLMAPDVLNSSDMIEVRTQDDDLFTRESRPLNYFYAIEKSPAAIVSEEMIKWFATIKDFNFLIGQPVNRYRQNYKDLEKLRQRYFEYVGNTFDFEKFVDYFKWIDESLSIMLMQLIPASANFADNVRLMLESHILERNKYWSKFPTLEMKLDDPEAGLRGINEMLYSYKRGGAPIPNTATGSNCPWWLDRTERDNIYITSGDSTIDSERDTFRDAHDFRNDSGPTLSTPAGVQYEGSTFALRNFTKPYRFIANEMPEIHGGSNFPRSKKIEYAQAALIPTSDVKLTSQRSPDPAVAHPKDFALEKDCNDDQTSPYRKKRIEYTTVNSDAPGSYRSGKGMIFYPWSFYSSSVKSGYVAGGDGIPPTFCFNADITNYHDDTYGHDKATPMQGPFTEKHVGGQQHRHVNINTASTDNGGNRPEAWTLYWSCDNGTPFDELTLTPRNVNFPRAIYLRDEFAKRPLNIQNIKWGTSSQAAGNYRFDYQMLQTSGRTINNRYFVKSEGNIPVTASSNIISGVMDYALPRFDLTGTNKYIFVERFNAPGGPEVSGRGAMNVFSEEYSAYNSLNFRNLIVRNSLRDWHSTHCGQFGIQSVSGTNQGWRQPREQNYDTLANYHKVNKNGVQISNIKADYSREVEFVFLSYEPFGPAVSVSNYNRTFSALAAGAYCESNQEIKQFGFFQIELADLNSEVAMGLTGKSPEKPVTYPGFDFAIPTFWEYSWRYNSAGTIQVFLGDGAVVGTAIAGIPEGTLLKIVRDGTDMHFEHKKPSDTNWLRVHTVKSTAGPSGVYYPRMAMNGDFRIFNPRMGNPRYDNWFVQHSIPQSDLQYAWINNSYDRRVDQPLGHEASPDCGRTNFYIPSGTTSATASAVQFATASRWQYPEMPRSAWSYPINFANMLNFLPHALAQPEQIKYTLTNQITPQTRAPVGWHSLKNLTLSGDGKTLTEVDDDTERWDASALGTIPLLGSDGYFEITIGARTFIFMGLNKSGPTTINPDTGLPIRNIPRFSMILNPATLGVYVMIDGIVVLTTGVIGWNAGWKFRIARTGNRIDFLHDGGTGEWVAIWRECIIDSNLKVYPEIQLLRGAGFAVQVLSDIVINIRGYSNNVVPGCGYIKHRGAFAPLPINSHFLNLWGPYGYPSWKQIRTGETPVARYQRNNNFISFKKEVPIFASTDIIPANAGLTRDTLIHFTEPPVTFRYKPLVSQLKVSASETPLILDHIYGNNIGGFPNPAINNFLGTSIKCEEQMYDRLKGLYLNNPSDSPVEEFINMKYNEVVYPREIHAGLKKYRQRTKYAEVAKGTLHPSDTFSASLSDGINGIDRGPLLRRTFWRDNPIYRNRRSLGFVNPGFYDAYISGTLPNSQNYKDACATSVNGWGATPITFNENPGAPGICTIFDFNPNSYQLFLAGPVCTEQAAMGLTRKTIEDYNDCGELNSANFATINSYIGGNSTGLWNAYPQAQQYFDFPTASAYYYHKAAGDYNNYIQPSFFGDGTLRWRVAELSGKNPWFDTYEDYVQDIRGVAKNFTIIPEFRISQHMDYYADGKFKKRNDQFLTLEGAEITCSADSRTQANGSRGFNNNFFKEYSNTDFQKYFGKFSSDYNIGNITLKCNAVKKLLPYHGFYPSHRSLQLASMLSQSLGPYIGGLAWATGSTTDADSPPSGALAVQSLLQPYYAPGIMYNTIKSGIGVDWGAHTSSATISDLQGFGSSTSYFLGKKPSYRIPFESILDPLGNIGIPESSSNGDGRIQLLYPSYQAFSGNVGANYSRQPWVEIGLEARETAKSSFPYRSYELAVNNFFAEIPNFFLQDSRLKSIVSKRQGDISLLSGSTYYLDVYLQKSDDITMIESFLNGVSQSFGGAPIVSDSVLRFEPLAPNLSQRSYNGQFFGPQTQAGLTGSNWAAYGATYSWGNGGASRMGDPAYAPYVPPYFYGKSVVTLGYTADKADESGGFSFKKLFERAVATTKNDRMDKMFQLLGGYNAPTIDSGSQAAFKGQMPVSASLNIFGLFQEKETRLDQDGNLVEVVDAPNSDRTRWVISPRMETPVLNFASQPREIRYGKGMWSGYGDLLTSSLGITFGIEETYKGDWGQILCEPIGFQINWRNQSDVLVIEPCCDESYQSAVTRSLGTAGWDAGAEGLHKLQSGSTVTESGYWQCVIDQVNSLSTATVIGLSDLTGTVGDYTDLEYAIQPQSGGLEICGFGTSPDRPGSGVLTLGTSGIEEDLTKQGPSLSRRTCIPPGSVWINTDTLFSNPVSTATGNCTGSGVNPVKPNEWWRANLNNSFVGIASNSSCTAISTNDSYWVAMGLGDYHGTPSNQAGWRVYFTAPELGGAAELQFFYNNSLVNTVAYTAGNGCVGVGPTIDNDHWRVHHASDYTVTLQRLDRLIDNTANAGWNTIYEWVTKTNDSSNEAGAYGLLPWFDLHTWVETGGAYTPEDCTFRSTRRSRMSDCYKSISPSYVIYESGVEKARSSLTWDNTGSFKIGRVPNNDTPSGRIEYTWIPFGSTPQLLTRSVSTHTASLYPAVNFYNVNDSISSAYQYPLIPCDPVNSASLLQRIFEKPEQKQVGEIADQKEISEAIVAIPFATKGFRKNSRFAATTVNMNKNFFAINDNQFDLYRKWLMSNKFSEAKSSPNPPSDSIQKMLTLMDKYIIPPELDFLTFNKGSRKVKPFVMYLFEFNHTLNSQDLSDIWQGLMPNISKAAQLSTPGIDDNEFSHPTGPNEFFHGKEVPEDIRWMIFKVKKRANFDYFKLTADTSDDTKFDFKFNVGGVELPYSYNWPYDYCSLVELAEIEVEDEFVTKVPTVSFAGRRVPAQTFSALRQSALAGQATTGSGGGLGGSTLPGLGF